MRYRVVDANLVGLTALPVSAAMAIVAMDAFAAIVRRPYGVMPTYSPNVLSDEILKGIHEYLRSIK